MKSELTGVSKKKMGHTKKRSKTGCLVCKIRKKKCDEKKPTCGDCARLDKECIWIDYDTMLEEEILTLRSKKSEEELNDKKRKRRPKIKDVLLPSLAVKLEDDVNSEVNVFLHQPVSNTPLEITQLTPASPGVKLPLAFLLFLKDLTNNDEDLRVRELVNLPSFPALLDLFAYDPSMSTFNDDVASHINNFLTPLLTQEPTYMPELDLGISNYLYNYYVNNISRIVLVSPSSQDDSNAFQRVFLPLANKNEGVLYAILGWAGFHLGGKWQEEGAKYTQLAIEHLNKELFHTPVDLTQGLAVTTPLARMTRDQILVKLATLLILCGLEICRGDVKNWTVFLMWGWKLLAANGGILNFNQSKEEHWLISNFAYHDLLLSLSNQRGTYFGLSEYEEIFRDHHGWSRGNLNPLLGVAKRLIRILGDILTLIYDSKRKLNSYYCREVPYVDDNALEGSDHGVVLELLLLVIARAQLLEQEINDSYPDPHDLEGLTTEELELQLTMFEAFQLSAKLFLKQLIMKCNPSMLECQVLNNDLIKRLDILVGSLVQLSLVFPAFMAGIHLVTPHDRDLMRRRMDNFIKHYGMWNVSRAKYLMEQVWDKNNGNSVIDWYAILDELGWDINFA